MKARPTAVFVSAFMSLMAAGCSPAELQIGVESGSGPGPEGSSEQYGSIVDVATAAGDFGTLLAAVGAAGLEETLDSEGPFTVFAPTDDAFASLPDGTVDALLADVPALTDVLLYHVVPGALTSGNVVERSLVETAQGSEFRVTVDGGVFINEAEVIVTDVQADNGVIHVIDTVITPPGTIVDIASDDEQFEVLVAALTATNLVDTLDGPGPFTVFAPTDDAFAALPSGTVEALLGDVTALTDVLLYHVVDDKLPAETVVGESSIRTLQGSDAEVATDMNTVTIAGATIQITDIPASNGVIHVIDAVMIPQ